MSRGDADEMLLGSGRCQDPAERYIAKRTITLSMSVGKSPRLGEAVECEARCSPVHYVLGWPKKGERGGGNNGDGGAVDDNENASRGNLGGRRVPGGRSVAAGGITGERKADVVVGGGFRMKGDTISDSDNTGTGTGTRGNTVTDNNPPRINRPAAIKAARAEEEDADTSAATTTEPNTGDGGANAGRLEDIFGQAEEKRRRKRDNRRQPRSRQAKTTFERNLQDVAKESSLEGL